MRRVLSPTELPRRGTFDGNTIRLADPFMKIFGQHDEATIQQLKRCAAAEADAPAVLCADGHLGYSMPIGGVVGYRDHISPSGVGYDIACGNLGIRTNLRAADLPPAEYDRIADVIQRRIS